MTTAAGALIFIVPGVMIAGAWAVAAPARINEPLTVLNAFVRSAELTRGNRWRVLALICSYWSASLALNGLTGLLEALQAGAPIKFAVDAVGAFALLVIAPVGQTAMYVELRGETAIAEVFA